jgi:putative two-component system response regulator
MFKELTGAKVLIVDDEPVNVHLLERILSEAGFSNLYSTTDSTEVASLYDRHQPDILLLDLSMPFLDGFAVMAQLHEKLSSEDYMPILVLTADVTSATRQRALSSGAMDFLVKPLDVSEVLLRIKNLLHTRLLTLQIRAQNEQLEQKVRDRTRELAESKVEILERLAMAGEYRDNDTGAHTRRVGNVAAALAQAAGADLSTVDLIRCAATLHDIGKIGVPDRILLKPGKLDPGEFELMKSHTQIGSQILSGGRDALLRMAERIALTHHEWWDGSGYPSGLRGMEIPLEGRVVSLADALDALTHARSYKQAWPLDAALARVQEQSGIQFDPALVDILLRLLKRTSLDALASVVELGQGVRLGLTDAPATPQESLDDLQAEGKVGP